ncbi:hypothetical protein H6F74_01865 [Trichocoleus sp. FACHB-90]|uniref:hypothetical protein n=1 Tax=Cyanophyceae TaxID=3028117 RepID=UPI00168314E7|nr:hypothetical protein [Trichocoleus sp. FACHB-90]MBD1925034.1 hypothetical protein [Trichocoleus sp. FACHB-90]
MNTLSNNDFVLRLEENARDSLVHAVEHFLAEERPTDLKYTVLHVFHAAELYLKARLAEAGKELIYQKNKVEVDGHTVNFKELKKRLRKVGVDLSAQDEIDLNFLQKVRNSIEHHEFAGNREEIEEYVGRSIYFLETFLQQQLNINLKEKLDEVDEEIYPTLSKAQLFYIRRMVESGISLYPKYKEIDHQFFSCEMCRDSMEYEETIVFPDPTTTDNTVHCFCCQRRYFVGFCVNCPKVTLSLIEPSKVGIQDIDEDLDENEDGRLCDRCIEEIAERDY